MMLETIREYALERLSESSEEETIQQRHAHFFMEVVAGNFHVCCHLSS